MWEPLYLVAVREGLSSGVLAKRDVIKHMQGAPHNHRPAQWWKEHRLHGPIRAAAKRHTVASLLAVYEDFGAIEAYAGPIASSYRSTSGNVYRLSKPHRGLRAGNKP